MFNSQQLPLTAVVCGRTVTIVNSSRAHFARDAHVHLPDITGLGELLQAAILCQLAFAWDGAGDGNLAGDRWAGQMVDHGKERTGVEHG